MVFCEYCKKEIIQEGEFCEHCGKRRSINEAIEVVTVVETPMEEPPQASPTRIKKSKNKSNTIAIIFGSIVTLGLVAGGIYLFLQYEGNSDDKLAAVPESTSSSSSFEESTSESPISINWTLANVDTTNFPQVTLYLKPHYLYEHQPITDFSNLTAQIIELTESNTITGEFQHSNFSELNVLFLHDTSDSMSARTSLDVNTIINEAEEGKLRLGFGTLEDGGAFIREFGDGLPELITDGQHSWNFKYNRNASAIYDGIIQGLEAASLYPGQRAVVVHSDFIDDGLNRYSLEEVIEASKDKQIPIYVLGIESDNEDTLEVMEKLAKETGGLYMPYTGNGANHLDDVYADYSEKYPTVALTFQASEGSNKEREIQISSFPQDRAFLFNQTLSYNIQNNTDRFETVKDEVEQQIESYFGGIAGNSSVFIADVSTGNKPIVTDEESVLAASTIKIFVMMEVFQQIKDGKFSLDQTHVLQANELVGGTGVIYYNNQPGDSFTIHELLLLMMADSDNTAANVLIDKVGGFNVINATIESKGFTGTQINRKMVDMDAIAAGKENYTSAADLGEALIRIYNQALVGPEEDREMLAILGENKNYSKIPGILPNGATVYNKTGEFEEVGVQNDAAIIETSEGAYVLVTLTEGGTSNEQIEAIKGFSLQLYHLFTTGTSDLSPLASTPNISYGSLADVSLEELDKRVMLHYLKKELGTVPMITTFQQHSISKGDYKNGSYTGHIFFTEFSNSEYRGTFNVGIDGSFELTMAPNYAVVEGFEGNIFRDVSGVEVASYFFLD